MPDTTASLQFLSQPQILAIDNNDHELELIAKGLFEIGIPVIPVPYDIVTGFTAPPLIDNNHLRIIFLDLNLSEIENSSAQISTLAAPIMEILSTLSPSGPYIIVFWTKHSPDVDDVMKYIASDTSYSRIHLPIKYTVIDKIPFVPIEGKHDPEQLKYEIGKALNEDKILLSLLSWESGVRDATARTLSKIVSLISNRQPDGTSLKSKDLKDILQNLGKAAWGHGRAKENPGRAVTHGLSPLLIDHLDSMAENQHYLNLWREALPNGWKRDLPKGVHPSALNSHCLIDLSSHDKNLRGNWFEFTSIAARKRAIWKKMFNTSLGSLAEEFINPGIDGSSSTEMIEIRKSVKLGLVECTAACDFANGKSPLQRYILCARIPDENEKYIRWEQPDRNIKHQAIYKIEKVVVDNSECILFLNFKYVLSLPGDHLLLGEEYSKVKFRIRNQVLTDITSRYASHTTRPGLFSFQSK